MSVFRRLLFSRRTLALASAGTVATAGGGYWFLNSGPTYPLTTAESRRPPPPWTPPSRQEMLKALKTPDDEFDLIVVGGGATGAGVALDAVTRGLKVAIIEREDFSAGAWFVFFALYTPLTQNRDVLEIHETGSRRCTLPSEGCIRARLRTIQARPRGSPRTQNFPSDGPLPLGDASHYVAHLQVRRIPYQCLLNRFS